MYKKNVRIIDVKMVKVSMQVKYASIFQKKNGDTKPRLESIQVPYK